jgi:hypothetical protein
MHASKRTVLLRKSHVLQKRRDPSASLRAGMGHPIFVVGDNKFVGKKLIGREVLSRQFSVLS